MIELELKRIQDYLIDGSLLTDSIKIVPDYVQFLGRDNAKWSDFWVPSRNSYESLLTLEDLQYIWQGPRERGGRLWQTTLM